MNALPVDELKAIAHPARLAIVLLLANGERNVGEIEQATGVAQPALSQQLAVLRSAGMVDTRRDAKLVYYSLNQDAAARLRDALAPLWTEGGRPSDKRYDSFEGAAVFARLT